MAFTFHYKIQPVKLLKDDVKILSKQLQNDSHKTAMKTSWR